MRIAIGSDERTHLTDAVIEEVTKRGHEVVLFGPLKGETEYWPEVARQAAESITSGQAEEGIFFCWTGTGIALAANKVPGIRAALVGDAETALVEQRQRPVSVPPGHIGGHRQRDPRDLVRYRLCAERGRRYLPGPVGRDRGGVSAPPIS